MIAVVIVDEDDTPTIIFLGEEEEVNEEEHTDIDKLIATIRSFPAALCNIRANSTRVRPEDEIG